MDYCDNILDKIFPYNLIHPWKLVQDHYFPDRVKFLSNLKKKMNLILKN